MGNDGNRTNTDATPLGLHEYLRYWGNDGDLMFDHPTMTKKMREAADEMLRLRDIVRRVPGYCHNCTRFIEDYQHKYDLHGPMADFCSQDCFDAGTVKHGRQ